MTSTKLIISYFLGAGTLISAANGLLNGFPAGPIDGGL